MPCKRFENFIKETDGCDIEIPSKLLKHTEECLECKNKFVLTGILHSQKGVFEKTPEIILINVRQRVRELRMRKGHPAWRDAVGRWLRPAIAFAACIIAVVAVYFFIRNSPVGVVDNLVERFEIPRLKYVRSGDMLYVAENVNVCLTLKNDAKLRLDSHTVLRCCAGNRVSLSRGRLYLSAGSGRMKIQTPGGTITLQRAGAVISTTHRKSQAVSSSRTLCTVIEGCAEIAHAGGTMVVSRGREIVLAEAGEIGYTDSLTDQVLKERASWIVSAPENRVYTAKDQLCDCVYDARYDSAGAGLHGKDIREHTFPVRIFWQTKSNINFRTEMDETFCLFNAGGGCTRRTCNHPGI